MQVTLRKFLDIVGADFIIPYISYFYEEIESQKFGQDINLIMFGDSEYIKKIEEINTYLDYEVISFKEEWQLGELDARRFYIRKI